MIDPVPDRTRLGILQQVPALFNRAFFERLASVPGMVVSVFAGEPYLGQEVKTFEAARNVQLDKAKNRYFPFPRPGLCWQFGWEGWLRGYNPDVIVLQPTPRLLSNFKVVRWARKRHRVVIGWGMGEMPGTRRTALMRLQRILVRALLMQLDGMICYSTKAASFYSRLGIPDSRLFIAHNCIDTDESERYIAELSREPDWPSKWRNALGLDHKRLIILFAGRLVASKRVDRLIAACIPHFRDCQLLIVGDGPARSDLESQAAAHRADVRFTGYLGGKHLAECFLGTDLFVLPSHGGLAFQQAMSYGKPVVVSVADGTEADMVKENENGFFFEPGNFTDLGVVVGKALSRGDALAQMGNRSLEMVRTRFNLENMAEQFVRAIATTRQQRSTARSLALSRPPISPRNP